MPFISVEGLGESVESSFAFTAITPTMRRSSAIFAKTAARESSEDDRRAHGLLPLDEVGWHAGHPRRTETKRISAVRFSFATSVLA